MVKTEIIYSAHPKTIINKIELIVKKCKNFIVTPDNTKIIKVHHDQYLL
jgi:hypothetical protein